MTTCSAPCDLTLFITTRTPVFGNVGCLNWLQIPDSAYIGACATQFLHFCGILDVVCFVLATSKRSSAPSCAVDGSTVMTAALFCDVFGSLDAFRSVLLPHPCRSCLLCRSYYPFRRFSSCLGLISSKLAAPAGSCDQTMHCHRGAFSLSAVLTDHCTSM